MPEMMSNEPVETTLSEPATVKMVLLPPPAATVLFPDAMTVSLPLPDVMLNAPPPEVGVPIRLPPSPATTEPEPPPVLKIAFELSMMTIWLAPPPPAIVTVPVPPGVCATTDVTLEPSCRNWPDELTTATPLAPFEGLTLGLVTTTKRAVGEAPH